jgi:hypothetical protein
VPIRWIARLLFVVLAALIILAGIFASAGLVDDRCQRLDSPTHAIWHSICL